MKRQMSLILVFVLLMTTLLGCASSSDSSSEGAPSGGETLEFTMSHAYPPSDFRAQGFAYFAEEVEKRTNGQVKITVHPSQSLVKLQDSYEAITAGTVDITALPSSYITNRIKDLSILDVSGSHDPEQWVEIEKAIYPIVKDILNEHNIQPLFPSYESFTGITLREGTEPVKTPDLKGYKIRDYGKYIAEGLKAWNGTPVNIPLNELNAAVTNNTVDGVYTGWPLIKSFKVYEPTPNVTFTGLSVLWLVMGMNLDSYNQLNDEQKQIFEEVKWEAMEKMEELAAPEFEQLTKDIEAAGGTIYTLTPEERKAFIDAQQPVFQAIEAEAGPNGKKLIEALKPFQ